MASLVLSPQTTQAELACTLQLQAGHLSTFQDRHTTRSYNSPTDCYAPRDLFNVTDASSGIYQLENYETNILIKLQPGVDGTTVAQQIRNLDLDIRTVSSFDEEWQSSNQMNNVVTYTSLQTLDMQGFGLIFAVISASVGTALIAIVSLKERSREATLMSVRGLSYRQLGHMFITESLAIITFAVILGVIVGLIIVYGTVASANNSNIYSLTLVTQRMIFPADAIANNQHIRRTDIRLHDWGNYSNVVSIRHKTRKDG